VKNKSKYTLTNLVCQKKSWLRCWLSQNNLQKLRKENQGMSDSKKFKQCQKEAEEWEAQTAAGILSAGGSIDSD
jgi:hypothetical protein